MQTIRDPAELEALTSSERAPGETIGLVPTMGSLHPGHASLMALLRPRVDRLVVSVYVNPLQFGPGADLERYPRDLRGDAALCREQGVDVLFAPPDLYPDGFATSVEVHGLTDVLCGASRPGHFTGVATVCARLFGLTRCHLAAFGEKDFQQLVVLRRMVEDLALPLQIVAAPLVRDADGVALSSRNKHLSPNERRRAQSLHRALSHLRDAAAAGTVQADALLDLARQHIDADRIDYLALVDAHSLAPITQLQRRQPARALVAAHYGQTRLIDNVAVEWI